ncbi:MAG: hypothetical protein C0503_04120 [Gemmatimonas sp.]|nr:hypothetical protein [Gemmatimonas sp.]
MKQIRVVPLALLAVALPLGAQQAPRTLPAPQAEFEEPFSQIGGIRELRDGRVIVADPRDKVVSVIDFRSGSSSSIGREGSGPQEFGLPMRLYTAPGDTTLLFDPLNSRYLIIGPDAKPINTFRLEDEAPRRPQTPPPGQGRPQGGPQITLGGLGFSPRASDARGRLYGEGSPITPGPEGPIIADSVPLIRMDRATRRMDTLTYIVLPKSNTQVSGGGNNQRVMIGGANPLAPRDEWAVFPDGRVAVARAKTYQIEFIAPDGTKRSGPRIAYTPVRMNAAEIRYEEGLRNAARANQMSIMVTNNNGQMSRSAQMGPGANAPPLEPLTDWPEVKPPFRSGQASVWARPNGELWVRRTENAQARGTLYDVINAQGSVAFQVRLEDGVTLAGFGANTIYTTRKDADDLVYLRRHAATEIPLRGN